ncbi:MAG: hypothetical protein BZY81_01900 [SAR202 cluster bacterium Io17-Chloro-G4]|nr:MAG: hypothetical protein BZY81_01900 [SAR202 cluster bacterium Io17-Chloro-G4]
MYSQLRTTIATLRLSLAEIEDRERQLDAMISQFQTQLRRLPRQVIYGRTGLESSLAAMGEIEERLADSLAVRQRVRTIKKSATDELLALELVGKVDEARRSLQDLKLAVGISSENPGTPSESQQQEIRRLEQYIAEHSKQAEWAITSGYQEGEGR